MVSEREIYKMFGELAGDESDQLPNPNPAYFAGLLKYEVIEGRLTDEGVRRFEEILQSRGRVGTFCKQDKEDVAGFLLALEATDANLLRKCLTNGHMVGGLNLAGHTDWISRNLDRLSGGNNPLSPEAVPA